LILSWRLDFHAPHTDILSRRFEAEWEYWNCKVSRLPCGLSEQLIDQIVCIIFDSRLRSDVEQSSHSLVTATQVHESWFITILGTPPPRHLFTATSVWPEPAFTAIFPFLKQHVAVSACIQRVLQPKYYAEFPRVFKRANMPVDD
jgi:hypothetical protein